MGGMAEGAAGLLWYIAMAGTVYGDSVGAEAARDPPGVTGLAGTGGGGGVLYIFTSPGDV